MSARRWLVGVAALPLLGACKDTPVAEPTSSTEARPAILQMRLRFVPTQAPAAAGGAAAGGAARASVTWAPVPDENYIVPPDPIVAPDTVTAGVAFPVEFRTILLSSCWQPSTLTALQSANLLELNPGDEFLPTTRFCPDAIVIATRRTLATFSVPGVATIRVRGVRTNVPAGDTEARVERKVVVLLGPRN